MLEDEDLAQDIKNILSQLDYDRAYFIYLIDKLENESIDIKKIELKGSSADNQSIMIFFLQVNCLFGITENVFEEESCQLTELITRSLQL